MNIYFIKILWFGLVRFDLVKYLYASNLVIYVLILYFTNMKTTESETK